MQEKNGIIRIIFEFDVALNFWWHMFKDGCDINFKNNVGFGSSLNLSNVNMLHRYVFYSIYQWNFIYQFVLNNYLCFEIRPTTTIILIGTDSLTFIMLHMRMMCVYSPIRLIITSKHKSWWCWDAWKWWWNSLIIWIRYPGCVAISFFLIPLFSFLTVML